MGTKKIFLRISKAAILERFADIASLEASAIRMGRVVLACALAAMHTAVSVIPAASFASVLPVHGEIIRISRGEAGPSGSASLILCMSAENFHYFFYYTL